MLTIDDRYLPVTLSVPRLTDDEFWEFCQQYDDYSIEVRAHGELIIMALCDIETGARNATITGSLVGWSWEVKRGIVVGSDAGFLLPNGARRSADAAWLSNQRFGENPTCPEFIIELISPLDRLERIHEKMLEWMDNGAQLGWIINPAQREVSIYRRNGEVEVRKDILQVEGEGPVDGFVLDLREAWDIELLGFAEAAV